MSSISQASSTGKNISLLGFFLFLLTFTVFFPAIRNGIIYWYGDDPLFVFENSHVNTGLTLENIKWAFLSTERSNWFPLTWLSYMADCALFGLKPWGFHLTNVLLHAANTALLFVLLRKMTAATWRSFAVAILFGLHPLRVESVAWIAERKDVLSTFFWMLTLLMYVRYVETARAEGKNKSTFYFLALLFFACGLMSKAMVVTLPCVLFLLDWWLLRRVQSLMFKVQSYGSPETSTFKPESLKLLLLEKLPFFGLTIAACIFSYIPQKNWGFVRTLGAYSLSARFENVLVSYARYLGKIFWPNNLLHFYDHPGRWPLVTILLSGALIAGLSWLAFSLRRTRPYLMIGWLWFLGTLVPVIGIVQVGDQALANRYVYIPCIGILVAVIWALHDVTKNWRQAGAVFVGLLVMVLVPCVAITRKEISYFKDGIARWSHDVEVGGKYGLAHYALALSLKSENRAPEAIEKMRDILTAKPEWAEVRANLANILADLGKMDEAIAECQKVLQSDPHHAQTYYTLGWAFRSQGRFDEARAAYEKALDLVPGFVQARYGLAVLLSDKGQHNEAIVHLQKVLETEPLYVDARGALGNALAGLERFDEAFVQFKEALRLNPASVETLSNFGVALANAGQTNDAIKCFEEALRIRPDFVTARNNLKEVLGGQ